MNESISSKDFPLNVFFYSCQKGQFPHACSYKRECPGDFELLMALKQTAHVLSNARRSIAPADHFLLECAPPIKLTFTRR